MLEDEVNLVVEISCWMCSDRKIIHVDYQPMFAYVVSEVVVHKRLESRGWATEPKEHYGWFEQPQRGDERGLPFISFFYPYIVVAPAYVELGEVRELL